MATVERKSAPKDTILRFRLRSERVALLQLIADSETQGNISELMRRLAEDKISQRLRRAA